jgi:hypothetical protein
MDILAMELGRVGAIMEGLDSDLASALQQAGLRRASQLAKLFMDDGLDDCLMQLVPDAVGDRKARLAVQLAVARRAAERLAAAGVQRLAVLETDVLLSEAHVKRQRTALQGAVEIMAAAMVEEGRRSRPPPSA